MRAQRQFGVPITLLLACFVLCSGAAAKREFGIDYANDQFVKDGQPFKYVSGSFHYFRAPAAYWRDRLHKMRLAGLNAVSTYVEWRLHEKQPGVFDFGGDLDLEHFLSIAQDEGLLVLLRPGPYICAERDLGGLPSWLLKENPHIKLRTNDATYMGFVRRWFTVLMTRLTPYMYGNGGPIIMVQVENEYGSYPACDTHYLKALSDILRWHVGESAVLYSTDGNSASFLKCGKVQGVYATVDFGTGANVSASFEAMRKFEPQGPLVNSEFYPGWLDHWGEAHNTVDTVKVIQTLEEMFNMNANVNLYMFYGGTNFGFTAGSNYDGFFDPQLTSYDYDAPLTEAGDPTQKYMAIRAAVNNYLNQTPSKEKPVVAPKASYGNLKLNYWGSLFKLFPTKLPVNSVFPITFEELDQAEGYVAYKTVIANCFPDPALLEANGLNDRGYVYVNRHRVGVLSRTQGIHTMPISARPGDELIILVENQGRINYGSHLKDFKGLTGNVTINKEPIKYWSMLKFPFQNYGSDIQMIHESIDAEENEIANNNVNDIPSVYWTDFHIPRTNSSALPLDTFFDPIGWTKGIVFMNGFNLGRYWPRAGPQRTLLVPGSLLNANSPNRLVVVELERSGCSSNQNCTIGLVDAAVLDALCPN